MFKRLIISMAVAFFIIPLSVAAAEGDRVNNKFGIHLAQPHLGDLKEVARLVNSNGGKWGYVTLVIQEDDRNQQKWQEVFEILREEHLIPIIRLASKPEGALWKRPVKEEAENWTVFLDSLNWVVKDRYIILFNEPNHGAEWGGAVDPEGYREIAFEYAKKLKEKNNDFFIMLSGFDASAPSGPPKYEDEQIFLTEVFDNDTTEKFNSLFSGWASHSYPNPGFAGSPNGWGKGTVRTYQWELEILRGLGVKENLPVFITETGWSDRRISRETIALYYSQAYENIWLSDDRVVAVTPFVFDYQGEPFIDFSWKRKQGGVALATASEEQNFYPQYYLVQAMDKIEGQPAVIEAGKINFEAPKELVANSSYNFKLKIKNSGQAVWDKDEGYFLKIEGFPQEKYLFPDLKKIRPFEEVEINFYLKTNSILGPYKAKVSLYKNDQEIISSDEWNFNIAPLPSLKFKVGVYPKLKTEGEDFELQMFDAKNNLILKRSGLRVRKGIGYLDDIQNIILNEKYRVVVLRPYYLPRQAFVNFKSKENEIKFDKLIPLDFNVDGKFSLKDFSALTKNWRLLKMLFP